MSLALTKPENPAALRDHGRLRGFAETQRPSLVAGAVAAVLLIAVAARLPWADDLMLHLSVLHRLTADPLHPGNPVLDMGGSSIYYSPYMLVLALTGKLFGLGAATLYAGAAVVNVLLLLTGLYRFVRTLSEARWAPPLALIGLAFWWGTSAIAWSGFLSLLSLADTEAYPSTLATALTLHLWATLNSRDARWKASPARMAGLGALYGVILLTHQFTALNAGLGCLAILIAQLYTLRTDRTVPLKTVALALGTGLAVCAAVVAAWPYYHIWSVSQGELDVLDPVHRPLYAHMTAWFAMGVTVGAVALAVRSWRTRSVDALLLIFLICGAVVGYGWITGHWSYGRTWPMVMLAAQLALAVTVAESRLRLRWLWGAVAAVMTAVGLVTQAGALVYLLPSAWQHDAIRLLDHGHVRIKAYVDNRPHADWLDTYLKPGDVVAADNHNAQFEIAAHGAYDVTTPWYLPEVPAADWAARNAATAALFAPDTAPATRTSLLRTYHVDWLLLVDGETPPPDLDAQATAHGDGFWLYRVAG